MLLRAGQRRLGRTETETAALRCAAATQRLAAVLSPSELRSELGPQSPSCCSQRSYVYGFPARLLARPYAAACETPKAGLARLLYVLRCSGGHAPWLSADKRWASAMVCPGTKAEAPQPQLIFILADAPRPETGRHPCSVGRGPPPPLCREPWRCRGIYAACRLPHFTRVLHTPHFTRHTLRAVLHMLYIYPCRRPTAVPSARTAERAGRRTGHLAHVCAFSPIAPVAPLTARPADLQLPRDEGGCGPARRWAAAPLPWRDGWTPGRRPWRSGAALRATRVMAGGAAGMTHGSLCWPLERVTAAHFSRAPRHTCPSKGPEARQGSPCERSNHSTCLH